MEFELRKNKFKWLPLYSNQLTEVDINTNDMKLYVEDLLEMACVKADISGIQEQNIFTLSDKWCQVQILDSDFFGFAQSIWSVVP